jgi:hypothetical protein
MLLALPLNPKPLYAYLFLSIAMGTALKLLQLLPREKFLWLLCCTPHRRRCVKMHSLSIMGKVNYSNDIS